MTINVGILGFAHGHVKSYCKSWRESSELGINLVAGWDHDAQRASDAADTFGITLSDSPETLLGRDDITAVVIAAETSMHADLAEQAARAGKAIIMQKPFAVTLEQADRIVAAVEQHKVPFTMAWLLRTDPQNQRIKELIESGTIGKVLMVRRRHGLSTHLWPNFEESWHVKPELNGSMWADDAAHPMDFLLWLLGEPVSVTAEIDTLLNPKIIEDNGIAIFRFADGTIAEVCSSFTCVAGENTTEVVGEKGVIIQNYGDVPSCNVPRDADSPGLKWYLHEDKQWHYSDIASPDTHSARIVGLSKPLADFLHGKREPIADVYAGRTALRMLLASQQSARDGRRVQLSEI